MWQKTYEKEIEGVSAVSIWNVWSDIDKWPKWNPGIQRTKL